MRVHRAPVAIAVTGIALLFTPTGLAQQTYLKASKPGILWPGPEPEYDRFGSATAMSGDTMIVGAPGDGDTVTGYIGGWKFGTGAAHVWMRSGTAWTHQAYIKGSNTSQHDFFGISVAISGDTAVIGAQGDGGTGAAYVFVRNGSTWSEQARLTASNAEHADLFGGSVAISDETVVVGARREASSATSVNGDQFDNNGVEAGAAYVFVRTGTTWSQQAYLKASSTSANDLLGWSVAISGDTVIVTAPGDEHGGGFFGVAHVFTRNGASWTQQASLTSSSNSNFGHAVAMSGDTVAIGAPGEGSGGQFAGAAYVFARSGTTWSQSAYLKAPHPEFDDNFGNAVAVHGNWVVVGAPLEDSNATGIDGNQFDNSVPDSGAAYVFGRAGTTWIQRAYLKASNTGYEDEFGRAVAVTGSDVVVGAPFEDSYSGGANGDQGNNGASNAGAVYVFNAPSGAVIQYAAGCPGSNGMVPQLWATGSSLVGSSLNVKVSNGKSKAPCLLLLGTNRTNAPFGFGCSILVGPLPVMGLHLSKLSKKGKIGFGGKVPAYAAGTVTTMQVFLLDDKATARFSASNGLEVIVP